MKTEILAKQSDTCLIFHTRDEMTKVRLDKVACFEADGNYTTVMFANGYKTSLLVNLLMIEKFIDNTLRRMEW